jgi:glutamate racemase
MTNPLDAQANIHQNQPIGVFDSGVGGISVLKHIHALLPNEQLIYVADSQHAPYGNKPEAFIRTRCLTIAELFMAQQVKAMVVACNTATAAVISQMRSQYDMPIIGMEPAIKPAVAASKNGKVGVLATVGTLKSTQFSTLLQSYAKDAEIYQQGCEGLVDLIERGERDGEAINALLKRFCTPLIDAGVDTIVLGCTHYPFIKAAIQQLVGNHVEVIDTGAAIAKQLQRRLGDKELLIEKSTQSLVPIMMTNGQKDVVTNVMQALWGANIKIANADF